ncbi:hypothetical protein DFQ27_008564 [Actinomortierella ambigua]|uniref:Uncharacterized protein n=1 Tax=Actinomortierella ambigua TaxID=1343610 RepID=A0A9P6TXS2_9FUNG|nr:hypothetical protein DFQ27_008564 [Actinomortierella ambigua]
MNNITISCIAIIGKQATAMKAQDMYLGVLFSMEDLSVYGYMTNTRIKFITVLTVPDVIIKDLDMKNLHHKGQDVARWRDENTYAMGVPAC